ncbi:MAG: type II secretion system F family protein [Rubrivivax sp.]
MPVALDLVSLCLAAGLAPHAALRIVGEALRGRLGDDFRSVAAALELGSSAAHAWAPVLAGRPPSVHHAAARFAHAERSGAALAPALAALAADQRSAVQVARARAARRVGVLAAGPLGLCFLPAFILIGVVPVVAGLVSRLALS